MSTTEISVPVRHAARPSLALRGAQAIFFIPLGLLQLVAAIVFSITDDVQGAEYLIGVWAIAMAATGVVVALRLGGGSARIRKLALALLAAQTAFSAVKLTVYHESASFVFFALIAIAAALLTAARAHAEGGVLLALQDPRSDQR